MKAITIAPNRISSRIDLKVISPDSCPHIAALWLTASCLRKYPSLAAPRTLIRRVPPGQTLVRQKQVLLGLPIDCQ